MTQTIRPGQKQQAKLLKLRLGLILFMLGSLGILSILTMEIPIPEEARAILEQHLTLFQIKLLSLINPAIMLLVAVAVGVNLYKKVKLEVPLLESLVTRQPANQVASILKYGIMGGFLAGAAIIIISLLYEPWLPLEFIEAGKKAEPTLALRFLYGGLTEEILMRFGLMTFIVWLGWEATNKLTPTIYWFGIIIAAILFAVGHFPILYQLIPSPSPLLLSYILVGNISGGLVFGWLYWKKGLESAMVAHIFGHVVMVLAGLLGSRF